MAVEKSTPPAKVHPRVLSAAAKLVEECGATAAKASTGYVRITVYFERGDAGNIECELKDRT